VIESHLLNMLLYSLLATVVFSILTHEPGPERTRYGVKLFAIMTLGSLVLAWLMFPFPRT